MFQEIIENFHETRDFKATIAYFEKNPSDISNIIKSIPSKRKYPFAEYSSWILIHITQHNKQLVVAYQKTIIDVILSNNQNQTVYRNCLSVLLNFDLIDYKEGELIDKAISFIQNNENKVALQVYSIQLLTKFLTLYPELKEEFTSIIELYSEGRSAAYQSALKNYHKKVKKIK